MRVFIYELSPSKELNRVGIFDDETKTWEIDRRSFSNIENIEYFDADRMVQRFEGPKYYAVKEISFEGDGPELDLTNIQEQSSEQTPIKNNFANGRRKLVEKYRNGELDEDSYTEKTLEDIKEWDKTEPW